MNGRVLLIDDDELFGQVARDYLARDGIEVELARDGASARALAANGFSVAVVDGRLPDVRGLDLIEELGSAGLVEKFVVVTGYPEVGDAISALRRGILDFLTKPVELEELRLAVLSALRLSELERVSYRETHSARRERDEAGTAIAAFSPEIQAQIRRAASSSATLLILGETGTGKTSLARAIHRLGDGERPFVSMNCAAIPEDLLESELFGTEKGGFTGAGSRPGLFELADGGTLFLDELGELSLRAQAKVLAVVEDGLVRRVGSTRARKVRVRLVAATNRPLEERVREGTFREDLYFRLSVLAFRLPPLRERRAEFPALVAAVLASLPGGAGRTLSRHEVERLVRHPFRGNLRELRNLLERTLILDNDGPLCPSRHLVEAREPEVEVSSEVPIPSRPGLRSSPPGESGMTLEEVERRHIALVLGASNGNRTLAADRLGIGLATLRRHLARERTRSDRADSLESSDSTRSIESGFRVRRDEIALDSNDARLARRVK